MSETYQTLNIPVSEIRKGDKIHLLSINYAAMENARPAHGFPDVIVVKLQTPEVKRDGAYFMHSYPVGTHVVVQRAMEMPVDIRVAEPTETVKKLRQVSQDLARQGGVWKQHRAIVNDLIHSIQTADVGEEESLSDFKIEQSFVTVRHLQRGEYIRLSDGNIGLVASSPLRPTYSSQWRLELTYETGPHRGKTMERLTSEYEVFTTVKKLPKLKSETIDVRRIRPDDYVQFEDGRVYRVIGIRNEYFSGWCMIRGAEVSPTTLEPYPNVKTTDVTLGFDEMVTKWEFRS